MPKPKKSKSTSPDQSAVLDLKATENQELDDEDSGVDSDTAFADLGPRRSYRWVGWSVAAIVIVVGLFAGFHLIYASKIYPGVSVNGVYLGGMSRAQASDTLTMALASYQKDQIPVQYASTTLAVDLSQIQLSYDIPAAVNQAYAHGRTGTLGDRLTQIARGLVSRATPISQYSISSDKLVPYLIKIADGVDTPVTNAGLNISDTGRVEVTADQAGQRLDIGRLAAAIEARIAASSNDSLTAPDYSIKPSVTAADLTAIKSQADGYLAGPLTLNLKGANKTVTIQIKDMIGWVKVVQPPANLPVLGPTLTSFGSSPDQPAVSLALDDSAIAAYVANLAKSVDQPGQNAALTITNDVATVFQPEKTGYTLDQPAAITAIETGMTKAADQRALTLNIKVTEPDVTAASLNDLGINQLISEGVTYFPGSPSDRLHNIRVGAARFNGVLVKPGDTFSFEDLLGDVNASTGYLPAYVILPDHTEPKQYGGGLCQVSSTAYRAALLAGLPIVERHNHAYALGYYMAPYGVPGVDATVFNSSVDMRFLNDTGHYILIQTILSGTTLKFDFYGTKTKSGVIRGPYFVDPAGGAGWNPTVPSTTVFYRDVVDLSGNVIKTDTVTTHYLSSSLFTLD